MTSSLPSCCLLFLSVISCNAPVSDKDVSYGGKSVSQWVIELDADDENTRLSAANAVGAIGLAAVPAVLQILEVEGHTSRKRYKIALHEIGRSYQRSCSSFTETIYNGEEDERLNVLRDFISGNTKDALLAYAAISKGLYSEVTQNRKLTAQLVRSIWREMDTLQAALELGANDDNEEIQLYASNALTLIKEQKMTSVSILTNALNDQSKCVRCIAANALMYIGPDAKYAVPSLIKALDDKECIVEYNVAIALVEIDPKSGRKAMASLEAFLQEGKYNRERIEACLQKLRDAQL